MDLKLYLPYCGKNNLRAVENRVMNIFRPRKDEVKGLWRKQDNEKLHIFYSSPKIIKLLSNQGEHYEHDM
jgi:acyl-coenzyme A synthetase/AMP-(fatty) acid ligase